MKNQTARPKHNLARKRGRAAAKPAQHRREAEIIGKPPRIQPSTTPERMEAALNLSLRLRRVALPDAPTISMEQMPEIMPTLACHEELWERVAMVSMHLLGNGALARRDAELAILRTSWLCGAPYEWGEHVVQGKSAGLGEKEIERIIIGSASRGWSARDRAILLAAEELHDGAMISDRTWKTLAKSFDDKQLFELVVLIGQFTMVAYFQNALRLRLSAGNQGLRAR